MFRHLVKGQQWQLGPLLLLLLLLIMGRINISAAAKSSSSEANANNPTDDYDSEDDEPMAPAEQIQTKGPKPVFNVPLRTMYLGTKNKTQIDCSPKNFDIDKHSVLWHKNNMIIANGNNSLTNDYQVDAKMNLIIERVTKDTPGNYTCQIIPNINQTTIVKAGEDPKTKANGSSQINLTVLSLTALFLVCLKQLLP